MSSEKRFIKTRLAPTPSGFLHLGNAFSFALTAALARQTGALVLLRIDDMDRDRVNNDYIQNIFDTLHFLNISWQEGPENAVQFEAGFSQRHRLPIYNAALDQLKQSGKVYACTCSRTQILKHSADGSYPGTCRHKGLPLETPDACWRLNTSTAPKQQVRTLDGDLLEAALPKEISDFVVRKKDGFPAYQLTSVMDDLHFGVDLIVRGNDLWPSTLAQLYLASLLPHNRFKDMTFYHHTLLTDPLDRKLSKSAGDTSIRHMRLSGQSAAEVYARMAEQVTGHPQLRSWEDLSVFFQ